MEGQPEHLCCIVEVHSQGQVTLKYVAPKMGWSTACQASMVPQEDLALDSMCLYMGNECNFSGMWRKRKACIEGITWPWGACWQVYYPWLYVKDGKLIFFTKVYLVCDY